MRVSASLAAMVLVSCAAFVRADVVDIRDEPGGKRLLVVDGDDIRPTPGGERLLFVDGDDIRPEPGGKRLLFVDGDDVRPEPGGIRLLFLDGDDVRRAPGSPRLLFIDGQDIRDQPGGKRLFFIDGQLTRPQLVAVLYKLMPELFTLSAEEEAELKKAMAEAAAESDRAENEALFGQMSVINSNVDAWGGGTMTSTAGKDGFVYLDMQLKGAKMLGIGQVVTVNGYEGLVFAAGAEGSAGLAVYEFKNGTLEGKWVPINAAKDGSTTLGTEKLTGGKSLAGTFKIAEAKAPNNGPAYAGTLSLKKIEPKDAHQVFFGSDTYALTWDLGGTKVAGVGYSFKSSKDGEEHEYLIAAAGAKEPMVVGALIKESTTSVKDLEMVDSRGQAGFVNVSK